MFRRRGRTWRGSGLDQIGPQALPPSAEIMDPYFRKGKRNSISHRVAQSAGRRKPVVTLPRISCLQD